MSAPTEKPSHMAEVMHPGHDISVTPSAIRTWVDCSCGLSRAYASPRAALLVAFAHHHEVGGCNCPPAVVALEAHPTTVPAPAQPGTAAVSSADAHRARPMAATTSSTTSTETRTAT